MAPTAAQRKKHFDKSMSGTRGAGMIWHESSLSSCSREAFSGRNKRTIGGGESVLTPRGHSNVVSGHGFRAVLSRPLSLSESSSPLSRKRGETLLPFERNDFL